MQVFFSWYFRSVVSRYVLNPFWNWLVTLWPLWVAPNVVSYKRQKVSIDTDTTLRLPRLRSRDCSSFWLISWHCFIMIRIFWPKKEVQPAHRIGSTLREYCSTICSCTDTSWFNKQMGSRPFHLPKLRRYWWVRVRFSRSSRCCLSNNR